MFKKKIIPFVFVFVVMVSLFCLPVSAESLSINTGGAVISAVSSQFIRDDGSATFENNIGLVDGQFSVNNNGNGDLVEGVAYASSTTFNFSATNNYGILTVTVRNLFGRPYATNYNRIYDEVKGVNLGANCVLKDGVYRFTYEGYIPSCFRIATYSYAQSNVMVTQYFNFSFTPIDKATQDIMSNQDKNTQQQIQANKDLYDQEKNEIQSSGDTASDSVSAVPNQSDGFISAMGGLVSALSYNGTECAWTFPAIKLPAISGVMGEMVLSEEKPIDFSFWVNKMPSNILTLIRAITTIALVGYCFKELYSTISYVLTLKGGGE